MNPPQTTFDSLMPYLVAILMASVGLGFFLTARLYSLLRKRHPDLYKSLGSPSLFLNNSIQNGLAVQRFVLLGRFRQIDDPQLVRLCTFLRAFSICYIVYVVALMIFGSLGSPHHPPR
jgi:hypothetical protein